MNRNDNGDYSTSDSRSNHKWQPMSVGLLIGCGLLINIFCICLFPQPAQFIYQNIKQIQKSIPFHSDRQNASTFSQPTIDR
jgi:hypothetical protein